MAIEDVRPAPFDPARDALSSAEWAKRGKETLGLAKQSPRKSRRFEAELR